MKRIAQAIAIGLLMGLFLQGSSVFAQEKEEGHYYTITTWKLKVPADGSRKELNALMKEWYEKVTMKNDKVISSKELFHISGSDRRDWIVIQEYASWADIGAAQEKQSELTKQAWPDENARAEHFKKFVKYTLTHSDNILRENPELT